MVLAYYKVSEKILFKGLKLKTKEFILLVGIVFAYLIVSGLDNLK